MVNFLQFLLKTHSFLQKNAKKCKFLLIFTPIFSLKTNKSYKITIFTIANHPIFQNFPQNPLFLNFFLFFLFFFRNEPNLGSKTNFYKHQHYRHLDEDAYNCCQGCS